MITLGPYRQGPAIVEKTKCWGSYRVFVLDAQMTNPTASVDPAGRSLGGATI